MLIKLCSLPIDKVNYNARYLDVEFLFLSFIFKNKKSQVE